MRISDCLTDREGRVLTQHRAVPHNLNPLKSLQFTSIVFSRGITNYAMFLAQWFGKSIDRPNRCACQANCAAIAVDGLDRTLL